MAQLYTAARSSLSRGSPFLSKTTSFRPSSHALVSNRHASTVPSLSSLFCASNSINSRPTTRWNGSTLSAPLQRYIQHRQMCRETRPSELPGGTSPDQDLTNVVPGAKEAAKMHAPQQVAYHLQHKTHGHHATRHTHPLDSAAAAHTTPAGATPESGETKQNEYPFDAIFEDDQQLTQFQVPFYQVAMSNGLATVTDRKISKYELSYETGMPLRDLRPFTHQLNRKLQVAGLVTRPRSFLINIEPLQSIVMPDRLQIFNVEPEDQAYMTSLLRKLQRPSQACFEHRCLECILAISVKRLEQEANSFEERLTLVLNNATKNPTSQHLWDLREISDTIEAHGAYVRQTLSAITGVLSKDEYMNMMYLSRSQSVRHSNDHRDVELILEAAEDRLQALDHSCTMLQARITNAEQYLAVSNDTQRNEIIRITLYATIMSLGFAATAVVGSVFGMNLTSGLEHDPDAFYKVTAGMGLLFLGMLFEGYHMIRKVDTDRPRPKTGRSFKF